MGKWHWICFPEYHGSSLWVPWCPPNRFLCMCIKKPNSQLLAFRWIVGYCTELGLRVSKPSVHLMACLCPVPLPPTCALPFAGPALLSPWSCGNFSMTLNLCAHHNESCSVVDRGNSWVKMTSSGGVGGMAEGGEIRALGPSS